MRPGVPLPKINPQLALLTLSGRPAYSCPRQPGTVQKTSLVGQPQRSQPGTMTASVSRRSHALFSSPSCNPPGQVWTRTMVYRPRAHRLSPSPWWPRSRSIPHKRCGAASSDRKVPGDAEELGPGLYIRGCGSSRNVPAGLQKALLLSLSSSNAFRCGPVLTCPTESWPMGL